MDPVRYDLLARTPPEGPIDVASLVPGDGPVELEIGFGRGRFLLERARAAPASRIVGVERKAKWAHLVEQKRIAGGVANAVALRGDARLVLPRMAPDRSIARAFVLFPDPWWKKRHAKRRVVDDDLLVQLARLLAPGGELFVETDVEERAAAMRDRIALHGGFELAPCDANPFGARSNREARADEDGLPIFRILARRLQ